MCLMMTDPFSYLMRCNKRVVDNQGNGVQTLDDEWMESQLKCHVVWQPKNLSQCHVLDVRIEGSQQVDVREMLPFQLKK